MTHGECSPLNSGGFPNCSGPSHVCMLHLLLWNYFWSNLLIHDIWGLKLCLNSPINTWYWRFWRELLWIGLVFCTDEKHSSPGRPVVNITTWRHVQQASACCMFIPVRNRDCCHGEISRLCRAKRCRQKSVNTPSVQLNEWSGTVGLNSADCVSFVRLYPCFILRQRL